MMLFIRKDQAVMFATILIENEIEFRIERAQDTRTKEWGFNFYTGDEILGEQE